MSVDAFFKKIRTYADLSEEAERAWASLLQRRQYSKEESFIVAGKIPTTFAFVVEGLFSQHYVGPNGDMIIKYQPQPRRSRRPCLGGDLDGSDGDPFVALSDA